MNENYNLYEIASTGSRDTNTLELESNFFLKKAMPAMGAITLLGALGTGNIQPLDFNPYQQNTQIISTSSHGINAVQIQLETLKKSLGLTISQLAAILLVSRPTIYDWFENEDSKPQIANQTRLNQLETIAEFWKQKNLGRLGSYLHRPTGNEKSSLFTFLIAASLNENKIHERLNVIAQAVRAKREKDQAHETLLKKHGFEPVSKEEMNDRLNEINF
jgi:hypothetical protein